MRLTYRTYRIAVNCTPTFTFTETDIYQVTAEAWHFLIWNNQGILVWSSEAEGFPAIAGFAGAVQQALGRVDALVEGDFTDPVVTPITSPF